jgi:hypothetical protein
MCENNERHCVRRVPLSINFHLILMSREQASERESLFTYVRKRRQRRRIQLKAINFANNGVRRYEKHFRMGSLTGNEAKFSRFTHFDG